MLYTISCIGYTPPLSEITSEIPINLYEKFNFAGDFYQVIEITHAIRTGTRNVNNTHLLLKHLGKQAWTT